MEFLPKAFEAMGSYRQFIIFVLVNSKKRPGKTDKFPVDHRSGKVANAHDSNIWLSSQEAISIAKSMGRNYGVGFVFTPHDPFFFIDIDGCLEPCGTKWSPLAINLLSAFSGAAVEVSSSGKGLHIIAKGSSPEHSCKNINLNLEFYTSGRFVALTGLNIIGSSDLDFTQNLPWLVDNFFKMKSSNLVDSSFWSTEGCAQWKGPVDDDQLIDRMLRSQSASSVFGGKTTFRELWEKNEDSLIRNYPDHERAGGYDESSADAALAQRLAYYTGNNCERMLKLMWRSSLTREKWNREDYLPRTIRGACGRQKEWLFEEQQLAQHITNLNQSQAQMVAGNSFMGVEQQAGFFKGCTYILSSNKVLIPGGLELEQSQFKSWYGGFNFVMDSENRRVSRNAWEAFTENQAIRHSKVHGTTFKPQEKPGALIEEEGRIFVNNYWPLEIPKKKGDPSPFLNHLDKLCEEEREAQILLSYVASLIRYKGFKFDWCPLIQGVEGNGKSLITLVAMYAVGKRYTQMPRVQDIGEKFNGWTYGTILIGVEDVRDRKRELIEILKPMVTLGRQSVEPKFENQRSEDVCFNFIMNTNHRDGLHKTRNDRRIAPFFTKQQSKEDLKRDGMDAAYFSKIFDWLLRKEGLPILADFFENFDIPEEFDPTKKCRNAPITAATEVSISEGIGSVEQEILEAIEQGQIGFKNGWISSIMLDALFTRIKANIKVPLNRRRDMLRGLGYDWHPVLKDGRVNNIVMPDCGKPRLFITHGHPARNLSSAAAVAKAYSDDQSS